MKSPKPEKPKRNLKARGKPAGHLRITAGVFKSRALAVPEGYAVRPTSDRARQGIFNRLEHSFQDTGFKLRGARVVDLFAGTGALGLEALSRGAAHVTFVEQMPQSLACLNANVATLGVEDKVSILRLDASTLPSASQPYDLALLDPPYDQGLAALAVQALADKGWLSEHAIVVAETSKTETLTPPATLMIEDVRAYGRGAISFLVRASQG